MRGFLLFSRQKVQSIQTVKKTNPLKILIEETISYF